MSDHFSGPRALAEPHGDITDVYAFPSPDRPGHLVLAMDVHPRAPEDAFFSDAIACRFRLRPVTIAARGPGAAFAVGEDEFTFSFTFTEPVGRPTGGKVAQEAACTMPTGEAVTVPVNDERGRANGSRIFAGRRSDPFFFDLKAFERTFAARRLLLSDPGVNSAYGLNILSVVVEFDCAAMLGPGRGPVFAVVGETLAVGKLTVRLERVGRPEIKNIIMGMKEFDRVNRDLDVRDLYNSEDAFHLGHGYLGAYRARLNANLEFWDSLQGERAWPLDEHGTHPLTELLLQDFLIVDVSKPYTEKSYLEIEQAMLRGRTHATCGGRSLNDNFIDTMYTLLINGVNGPGIRQGVDRATRPASEVFPYLAPPTS
jgi:Domain of unknown function (DUF4331)